MKHDLDRLDLGDVLQIAVFAHSASYVRVVGKLPCWWSDEVGKVAGGSVTITSPFLQSFVSRPPDVWQGEIDGIEPSQVFLIEHSARQLPLQAIAVCSQGSHWLLVRSVDAIDTWFTSTLTTARRDSLSHAKEEKRKQRKICELTELRDEARRLERMRADFIANMGHELRTPLTTILGLTEHALRFGADDLHRSLDLIRIAAGTLERLSNDILDLSRLQSGKVELRETAFDIREFMGLFARESQLRVQPGVELDVHVRDDVPQELVGDSVRLRQVLANLVGNAIKFTREGHIVVDVALDASPTHISFSVSDTGVGIQEDDLSKIFDSFVQIDPSPTKGQQGFGLGLAIASNLVRLMSGSLNVTSRVDSGTCFSFDVPLLPSDRLHLPGCGSGSATRNTLAKTPRVLVAEDHQVNRQIIVDALASVNYEISQASNGKEAVDAWRGGGFDLILMDCHMPVMSGFDAIREIRREESDFGGRIPIVAFTAHATEIDRQRLLNLEVQHCLPKPFKRQDLLTTISRVLQL
jgi:signal transduction histidine kinase/ActR/RegA family two-component response regulator